MDFKIGVVSKPTRFLGVVGCAVIFNFNAVDDCCRLTAREVQLSHDWQLSNIARRRLGSKANPDLSTLLAASALSLPNERPRFRGMKAAELYERRWG